MLADGTDNPCISGNVLKDPKAQLNEGISPFLPHPISSPLPTPHPQLTPPTAEIKSIGVTMVSAGLDTVPGNLIMSLAYLTSPHGQQIQQRAHTAIQETYPDGSAWDACLLEEKVPYISAFVKEVLRFWTVIPICLPHVSTKEIIWQNATIPAGTTFYMNAWAANYDKTHFQNPERFEPERYLGDTEGQGTPHYEYGAGSRMCAGSHLGIGSCIRRLLGFLVRSRCCRRGRGGSAGAEYVEV